MANALARTPDTFLRLPDAEPTCPSEGRLPFCKLGGDDRQHESMARDTGNALLDAMEPESRLHTDPFLELVELRQGDVLCEASTPVKQIYFPQSCVLTLLAVAENGSTVETASIGRSGAFGVPLAMHTDVSFGRCVVLMSGTAYRIRTDRLRAEFARSEAVRALFMRYGAAFMAQVQQAAACNALHPTGARLSRWLLTLHNWAETDTLEVTHEFLAGVLGANRTTVTMAAGALQSHRLIRYARGKISILDRAELERASCECYGVMKNWSRSLDSPAL